MASDEVLRDTVVIGPEAADLADRPDEFYIDDDEVLVICGVEFPAQEFTESERLEWLKVREKHALMETEAEFRDLVTAISKGDRNNLLKAKKSRLSRIKDEITRIVETTAPLEWSEKNEEYLGNLAVEADALENQILELEQPIDQELYGKMDEMQSILAALKAKRDPAFLEMAWKLARVKHKEERSFEDWMKEARGSDRLAAQELVFKGNFLWEAPRLSRAQRRQLRKSQGSKKGSTTKTTGAITSKQ